MYRFYLFLVISLCFSIYSIAQEQDFRTWWAVELEGEVIKDLEYSLTPEIRFIENSSKLSSVLAELDLSYRVVKFLDLGGKYRYEKLQLSEQHNVNRFNVYAKLRYRQKSIRLSYRLMYQHEYVGYKTREKGSVPNKMVRHKILASYNIKDWNLKPDLSVEYFHPLNYSLGVYKQKLRVSAGLEYRFNKKIRLGVSYKYQEEYFANNPLNAYILATSLKYRL
jgi:predicted porin